MRDLSSGIGRFPRRPLEIVEPRRELVLRELVSADRRGLRMRRCGWCGAPCVGPACSAHRDLEQLVGVGAEVA